MSTLWFMNYNNYANRIVKKESSLNAYGTAGRNVFNRVKIDFNPNDGVTTTLIVDAPANHNPDYMLVVDTINNVDTITSRWFVIEWTRTRGGQYRASLKRDALIDNLDTIASSPILVQKGTVKNLDDICIYRKENIEYNQIKKKEALLKDSTGVGWLVGFATTLNFTDADLHQTLKTDYNVEYNQSYNGIDSYPYYQYREGQTPYFYCKQVDSILKATKWVSIGNYQEWTFTKDRYRFDQTNMKSNATLLNSTERAARTLFEIFSSNQKEIERIILRNGTSIKTSNLFAGEDGQIIRDTSTTPNTYYKVEVVESDFALPYAITSGSETEEEVCTFLHNKDNNLVYDTTPNHACLSCLLNGKNCNIKLVPIEVNELSGSIPTAPKRLNDAPYYMFAIPYGQTFIYTQGYPTAHGSDGFNTCSKEIALNIARNLIDCLGAGVKDIQLLPFCPETNMIKSFSGELYNSIENLNPSLDYTLLMDSDSNPKAIIFFPENSSFKGSVKLSNMANFNIDIPNNVEDFKIENETKKFRLTSPNFASVFEFKNTYNQKNIKNFNFRCTYRPYNSFVNVYPKEIGGLYGNDYRDNFGLIFQGDFSVPLLNDSEWKTYQINNKNYQNSFNRSIDTFDLEAKWAKRQDIVGAISGTVSGTAQGALATAGSPVGAIIGGVASASAGAMDIVASEQMRQNKRGEMIDQFNFSLENVQARPRTIANVGTFDINNKIFPILEVFDCTDEEKEILRYKLRYTGYTINKIAYLKDYMGGYFKGVVIFNEDIDEDSHVQEVINEELGKGVYTNGLSI